MIKIKKGLNLQIAGEPKQKIEKEKIKIQHVALSCKEYIGIHPFLLVKNGDNVIKGQPIFKDKKNNEIIFTSPACGKIISINHEKNKTIKSIIIKIDGNKQKNFAAYEHNELNNITKKQIIENLVDSGMWTSFKTRPFSKLPQLNSSPTAIFVTAIDTNPLSANPIIIINENEQAFNDGLIILSRLIEGKIYVCYGSNKISKITNNKKITYTQFIGPHPAGLTGTHIHMLEPVNIKKSVWSINYQDVIAIGKLFITGLLYTDRIISLAGPQVKNPRLIHTHIGADIHEICNKELKEGENRIISGSVFHGFACSENNHYLGRFHNQISVLIEDREKKLFGWIKSGINEFSITRTTIGHFLKKKRFNFTTRINGSKRPMFPIGNYEQIMPLDIMITNLLRELIVMDTDTSQNLGCLELDEEDLALCTYVCLSKYEYAPILRKVLNKIETEV